MIARGPRETRIKQLNPYHVLQAIDHHSQRLSFNLPLPPPKTLPAVPLVSPLTFQAPPKYQRSQTGRPPGSLTPERPDKKDLLTISDLSAPFANFCSIGNYNLPRRASVDLGGLALTLSRTPFPDHNQKLSMETHRWENGATTAWREVAGQGFENEAGWSEGGLTPLVDLASESGDALFCELVSEMHLQVKKTIQKADKISDAKYVFFFCLEGVWFGSDDLNGNNSLLGPMDPETRTELIRKLSGWNFKPYELSEDDLFRTTCILFEGVLTVEGIWDLGIDHGTSSSFLFWCSRRKEKRLILFPCTLAAIKRFLLSVRQIYHTHNPYQYVSPLGLFTLDRALTHLCVQQLQTRLRCPPSDLHFPRHPRSSPSTLLSARTRGRKTFSTVEARGRPDGTHPGAL